MTSEQLETAVSFLIARLPEDQLAELDGLLEGAAPQPSGNLAQDSARKAWLSLGSSGRQTVRRSKQARVTQDAANQKAFLERFPNADRLR